MNTDHHNPPAPAATRRPARWARWLLVAGAILVVGTGALAAAARLLLDEEILKRELGAKLGRTVAYERLEPGFFALSLEGLTVGDTGPFLADPLLEAGELRMSYSLLALLTGRLRIETIRLVDATVALERDSAGHSNVDDLLAPRAGDGIVQLETLILENVRLSLRDPSGLHELKSIEGALGRLSTTSPSFSLAAVFLGRPLSLTEGRLDLDAGSVALRARLSGLPLGTLPIPADQFDAQGLALDADVALAASPESAAVKGTLATGGDRVDLDLVLAWPDALTASGTVTATVDVATLRRAAALRPTLDGLEASGRLSATARLQGPLDRVPASVSGQFLGLSVKPQGFSTRLADLRGAFRASPEALVLEGVTLAAAGMKLGVSGTIGLAARTLDLAVKGDPVDFAGLAGLLDPPVLPPGVRIAGAGAVDIRLTGAMATPDVRGLVRLDGVDAELSDPPARLDDIRGRLQLAGDRVVIPGIDARLKSGTLRASGTYLIEAGRFDMALRADRVDLSELPVTLGVAGLSATGLAGFDGTVSGTASAPRVAGRISSPALRFFGVEASELSGRLLYDADAFRLDDFQARILGGLLKGDASASLGDPALPFTANIQAEALGLPQLLQATSGYAGATSGTLGATVVLAGKGSDRSSYAGTVSAHVADAGFGALPALEQLAPFLGLSADKVRSFRSASGSFSVNGGMARLSRPLKLEAAGFAVTADGGIGLDGALQLACRADLPTNSAVGRIGGHNIAQVLGVRQSGDRTIVPFTAGGTLFAPRFGLDVKAEDVVQGVLEQGLGRVGGENADAVRQAAEVLLGGQRPASPAPAPDSPAAAPPQGAVRNLPQDAVFGIVDGLLGRRRAPAPSPAPEPAPATPAPEGASTEKK